MDQKEQLMKAVSTIINFVETADAAKKEDIKTHEMQKEADNKE